MKYTASHILAVLFSALLICSCGIDEDSIEYRICEGATDFKIVNDTGRVYYWLLPTALHYIGNPDSEGGGVIPCRWPSGIPDVGELVVYSGDLRGIIEREGEVLGDLIYSGINLTSIEIIRE
ncbi:MAG: hypothetical protein RIF33_13680 [Cyclobacteriaceae bacterium]